ncbi:FAD-binding protein [Pseudomonas mosselii]|uniref:FAD-dependent oxidoreductase n=1 Tax=Pseudomonas mosselii TaxID=78327 RepID=UPI00244C1326|nr:FAD-dependent oxidoreductase [Pseudomonas mosselii]MDH1147167.1 FAD-binding protein [Pseudomonas mosselii]
MTTVKHYDFDVVIIGSGPAGVSSAFPLLQAGLRVLMVDGGHEPRVAAPAGQFLDLRRHDETQWRWMIGQDFHALRQTDAVSPKLRTPTHAAVFEDFAQANRIIADQYIAVGSLAPGGLSNAWGCGVACLDDEELRQFPVPLEEMYRSYETVSKRIGISGKADDDLSDFFGLNSWSQPPVEMDVLQAGLLARYTDHRQAHLQRGFVLGRSRVAVLTESHNGRQPCDRSGNCLWGCHRRALYSASDELASLRKYPGFNYEPGFVVDALFSHDGTVVIEGAGATGRRTIRSSRVMLAAGTIASTRLALKAINHRAAITLQACPTAAFLLWLPRHLGRKHDAAFGLGQLSFALELEKRTRGFGSLFSTTGIPVTEFARHMPLGKRYAVDVLASLLSSCVVGNLFLPGELSDVVLHLDADDQLVIRGGYRADAISMMSKAQKVLRSSFLRLGAVMMPTSFNVGSPGSDIHYAASLPMREAPVIGETNTHGELLGAPGIHVVDGASLSALSAKSHTLTIMANADRIARFVAQVGRTVKK